MTSNAPMTKRAWLLFAAMCVIWGVPYLLIRVAVKEVSPSVLVLGRTAVAALLLVPIAAARGVLVPALRRWRMVLVFAAVEIAVPWLLLSSAEQHLTSSLTGLLIAGVPLVAATVTRLTGERSRLHPMNLAGLLVGVLGVAALVGLDVRDTTVGPLLEMAVVVVCYALGPIVLARYLRDAPPLGVIAASLGIVAIVYAPIAAFDLPATFPSSDAALSIVGLSVVCTAVAFLVFFALIAEAGPVRATVITYVNPAIAAVLGVSILDERFTLGMAVGFVLVLMGSVLATRAATPRARLAAEPVPAEVAVRGQTV
jgi:drug/metabolite transporter (DMT)-like permease